MLLGNNFLPMFATGGQSAPDTLLDDMVLWWDFAESSGNRVDEVSNATASDVNTVTRVAGPSAELPWAAQFAATGTKYLTTPHSLDTAVSLYGRFTILCWYYMNALDNRDILGKGAFEYLLDHTAAPAWRFYCGNRNITYASAAATVGWHMLVAGVNSDNKLFLQVDNGTEEVSASTVTRTFSTAALEFGRSANLRYTNGRMAAFGRWNRYLSQVERNWLWNSGNGQAYPFGLMATATPEIISPVQYQVAQTTSTTGPITIVGSVRHGVSDVEASFNGGAYADLATAQKGLFTASLSNQANGQGTLALRTKSNGRTDDSTLVGLGDIFVTAGQSNSSGRYTNAQNYSHVTLKSASFSNAYIWVDMPASMDNNTGQLDTVSSDSGTTYSHWNLVASSYLAARGAPCGWVPCAKGGSTILQWQPGANRQDRTTLYGSMVYRALQTGAKAILWWQGEQDAFNGTSTAAYQAYMETIVNALATDLPGVWFIPCKLQLGNTYSDANAANIQAAIANVWAVGHSNVKAGPDFSTMRSESGDHFVSNSAAATVAGMWWAALQAAFGW